MTERTMTIQDHYSDGILTKANRLVKMDKVERDEVDTDLFRVKGSKTYKVRKIRLGVDEDGNQVPDDGMPFVTCDCPNGLARGGRPNCYHSAAVIIILQKEEEEAADAAPESDEDDPMNAEYYDAGTVSPGWSGGM